MIDQSFEIHGIAVLVLYDKILKPLYLMLRSNGGLSGILKTIWRGQAAPESKQ